MQRKQPVGVLTTDWKEVAKHVMICAGSYSQAHKKFKGYNQQSAATCIVACVFSSLRKMSTWTKHTLDEILEVGTNLHLKSRQMLANTCLQHMTPSQIDKYFFVDNVKISLRVGLDTVTGRFPRDSTLLVKLEDLLKQFFAKNTSGVFACQHTYFAIWKFDRYYFIFDPTEHSLEGGKWHGLPGFGYCYCIRTTTIKSLADIIMKNCPLKQINKFTIYPCGLENYVVVDTTPPLTLEKVQPSRPQAFKEKRRLVPPKKIPAPVEPKRSLIPLERPKLKSVTNFVELTEGKHGILRASTHQRDPKFTRYMGKQAMGNAIAALTMLRQYKAKLWNRKVLDDVLKLGEVIHHTSVTYPKKVTLNEVDYSPVIENYASVGRLESSEESILNLDQALTNTLIDTDCCILRHLENSIAFWKEDNRYYMFDPDERGATGRVLEKGQSGVACVIWFTNLSDLAAFYLNNVPKSSRQDRFFLSKVTIEDYVPTAEDWYNFKALTKNKWILRGNFSQQDRRFPPESRNAQCTANATMALAYKELKQEKDWDSETVDQVLINGDEFYRGCVDYLQECGKFKHKYLMVDELKRTFNVENKHVNLEVDDCLVNGIVNARSDTGVPNLKKGFEEFFLESEAGIVTANFQSMAVWKRNDVYYYYDSHSRNQNGVVCGFGTACVLRMVTIQDLTDALVTNLGPDPQNLYNISRVVVKLMDVTEEGVVKIPLNFYEALNELIGILRSNKSENNAGRQTIPMCLAALAFNALNPSIEWNKDELDLVLTLGDKLYADSMEANYGDVPEDMNVDEISTNNVKREIMIGPNKMEVEFEEFSSGNLEENLRETIETLNGRVGDEGNEIFQSIIESQYVTASIWRDDNLFYLFDPRPRDEKGQVYGKDDWSVNIEAEEEKVEYKPEATEEETKNDWDDDYDERDEMGGGDNLGEPEIEDEEDENELKIEDEEDENEPEIEDDELEGESEPLPPPPLEKKGSDFWRQKEKEEGKACVVRFNRFEDLVQHILENSPPSQRQNIEYSLKLVKVTNTPLLHKVFDPKLGDKEDEFVGDWNEFKEVDYGKWILRSARNLRDGLFPVYNRGRQATPMCVVALAFASLYALSKFNVEVVDRILAYGDRLYTLMRKLRSKDLKDNKELNLSEEEIEEILNNSEFNVKDYPRSLCMGEKLAKWEIALDVIKGDISSKIPETVHNLSSGLTAFFNENKFGILDCRYYPVAIWKREDIFYMFDPHPTGPSGSKSPIGVGCITRFKQLEDLAQIYYGNLPELGSNFFTIQAFTFTTQECVRERHPEEKEEKVSKIGGFSPVTAGKEILRGNIKLDCSKFDRGVNIHSAAIAFVTLALSLSKDPDTWTRMIINEILTLGEELYNDSIDKLGDKFNPWADRLDIGRVNNDFMIGRLKVNCAIRFTEQKGIVDVKNSKTLSLRQGLERFFEENSHGILVVDKFILPLWEQKKGDETSIYIFDPNSRGSTGLPGQGGVACVVKCCNAKVATDHLMACLMDIDKSRTEFAVVPVEVVIGTIRTKTKTPKPVTCPALETKRTLRKIAEDERAKVEAKRRAALGRNEMYELSTKEAIVRGLRSIDKDKELPVNIVAFVFMKIARDLSKWTCKQIELILEAGYQLYVDSFVAYKPETPKLTLPHLLRRIILKDCEVRIDVKKPIIARTFTRENLLTNLNSFFTLTSFCILSYDEQLVSLYFKSGYYYMFDPYSRDLKGDKTEKGCAMLMRFGELSSLIDKLLKNLQSDQHPPKRYALIIPTIQSVQPLTK